MKVGSKVRRPDGRMEGVVIKIIRGRFSGSSKAHIRVRWENGHEATLAQQQLVEVAP